MPLDKTVTPLVFIPVHLTVMLSTALKRKRRHLSFVGALETVQPNCKSVPDAELDDSPCEISSADAYGRFLHLASASVYARGRVDGAAAVAAGEAKLDSCPSHPGAHPLPLHLLTRLSFILPFMHVVDCIQ